MDNLWGDIELEKIKTPKLILEEQSNILKEKTKNILYVTVDQIESEFDQDEIDLSKFCYAFNLRSKYLEYYSYTVFTLSHEISIYPLVIRVSNEIYDELTKFTIDDRPFTFSLGDMEQKSVRVNDEEGFIGTVRSILSSRSMRHILSSIYSLSQRKLF